MTATTLIEQLPAWLASVGGIAGIGALFRINSDRRAARAEAAHKEADATKAVTDTAVGLLDPLKESVEFLTSELKASRAEATALRTDVAELHKYVTQLMHVIEGAGLPLPPMPDLSDNTPRAPLLRPRKKETDEPQAG
jgi:hypothetical protein